MDKDVLRPIIMELVERAVDHAGTVFADHPDLMIAVFRHTYPVGHGDVIMAQGDDGVIKATIEIPGEWQQALNYRYIEVLFAGGQEPAVRVVGGQPGQDPETCLVGTGVFRKGRVVWQRSQAAS